jgi:membrane protein YqaA with SNARE-associated domain
MDSVGAELGIYAGTFVICFLAGLVPVINAEVWLIAVTTVMIASPAPLPAIVVLAAAGQMIAKVMMFYAARGVFELPRGRFKAKVEAARAKIARWKDRPKWVLWLSAIAGLPPFYVITLVAGALGISIRTFCVIGMTGRVVRFGALVSLVWLGGDVVG